MSGQTRYSTIVADPPWHYPHGHPARGTWHIWPKSQENSKKPGVPDLEIAA